MTSKSFVLASSLLLVFMGGLCWSLIYLADELVRLQQGRPMSTSKALLRGSLIQPLSPCLPMGQPVAISNRIRICSYNIENFSDGVGDGPRRTEAAARRQARGAAALLDQVDPDILVLQEIENAQVLDWLNASLHAPYPVAFVTRLGDQGHEVKLNLAVLSRLAIEEVTEIDFGPLQGTALPPRGLLRFTLPVGEARRVLVYVVHLKSNFGSAETNVPKRQKALHVVAEDVRRTVRDKQTAWEIMILGDMNVDPDADSFADDFTLLPVSGFEDLWRDRPLVERATVPTRHGHPSREFPPVAFDRILVAGALLRAPWTAGDPQRMAAGVNTNDVDALPGVDETHVSDHYPVYVDLRR